MMRGCVLCGCSDPIEKGANCAGSLPLFRLRIGYWINLKDPELAAARDCHQLVPGGKWGSCTKITSRGILAKLAPMSSVMHWVELQGRRLARKMSFFWLPPVALAMRMDSRPAGSVQCISIAFSVLSQDSALMILLELALRAVGDQTDTLEL